MAAMKGVVALQKELEKTKDSLKDVDENIKKLTGRDPTEMRQGPQRRRSIGEEGRGRGRLFGAARRGMMSENTQSPYGRGNRGRGGAFSRLGARVVASPLQPYQRPDSGDEEDLPFKPTVQSSVVATPKDTPSREDLLNAEVKDEKSRTRNRRMFGLLLGTLQRFQTDEKKMGDKEAQRKAVEEKLEEKARQEKKDLASERQKLFNERKRKQQHLRRLEHKVELVAINEEWEQQTNMLMNFIRTKAKPHVYFLPKRQHGNSDKKLRETRKILQDAIEERRRQLETEIEEIMSREEEEEAAAAAAEKVTEASDKDNVVKESEVDEGQEEDIPVNTDRKVIIDDREADMDGEAAATNGEAQRVVVEAEPRNGEAEFREGDTEMDYEEEVEEEEEKGEVEMEERDGVAEAPVAAEGSDEDEGGSDVDDNKTEDAQRIDDVESSVGTEKVEAEVETKPVETEKKNRDEEKLTVSATRKRSQSDSKETVERPSHSSGEVKSRESQKSKHRERSRSRDRERRRSDRDDRKERKRRRDHSEEKQDGKKRRSRERSGADRRDKSRERRDRSRERKHKSVERREKRERSVERKDRRDKSVDKSRDSKQSPRKRSDDKLSKHKNRDSRSRSAELEGKSSKVVWTEKSDAAIKVEKKIVESESNDDKETQPKRGLVEEMGSPRGDAESAAEAAESKKTKGRWDMKVEEESEVLPQVALEDIALPP